ncbi:hypothetical protein BHE74_00008775 [Ensete ventricosum]|nr:hypothetical protein BHE74_00008775 [Ensete ventricosum]
MESHLSSLSTTPQVSFRCASVSLVTLRFSSTLASVDQGCGFESKKKYLLGQTSMQIKLVEGDSAGTVTAFYVCSSLVLRSSPMEFFLGYSDKDLLHADRCHPMAQTTTSWTSSSSAMSQASRTWCRPTSTSTAPATGSSATLYGSIRSPISTPTPSCGTATTSGEELEHPIRIVPSRIPIILAHTSYMSRFLVDGVPIRMFANKEAAGVLYPKDQAMGVYASVWNADDWATQGGRVKTNWSHAPFVTAFRGFQIDACEAEEEAAGGCVGGGVFWWDAPAMSGLSSHQRRQLRWVQRRHLVYDYCKDRPRFHEMPGECLS